MPKARKGFRFNPQLYEDFKDLASKNGYTETATLEKFRTDAVNTCTEQNRIHSYLSLNLVLSISAFEGFLFCKNWKKEE